MPILLVYAYGLYAAILYIRKQIPIPVKNIDLPIVAISVAVGVLVSALIVMAISDNPAPQAPSPTMACMPGEFVKRDAYTNQVKFRCVDAFDECSRTCRDSFADLANTWGTNTANVDTPSSYISACVDKCMVVRLGTGSIN